MSSDNPLPLHSRTLIAPQVHRLRLRHLALVIIQVTEIVDRVQRLTCAPLPTPSPSLAALAGTSPLICEDIVRYPWPIPS